MSENTQPVVDNPDGQVSPAADGQDAPDTLDAALAEFEASSEPEPEQPTTVTTEADPNALETLRQDIKDLKTENMQTQTRGDIVEAVKTLQSDLDDLKLPDATVTRLLHGYASTDQRFLKAFQSRHNNPNGWNRVLGVVGKEIREEFGSRPDAELTADREAVGAAVRHASTSSPESAVDGKKLNAMTDAEFDEYKKGLG